MKSEQQLIDAMQALLQASEAELDADIRTQLMQARQQAVVEMRTRPAHEWLSGFISLATAAGVAALVASLWLKGPLVDETVAASLPQVDVDLLAESENLEFYSDLAFYKWLDSDG